MNTKKSRAKHTPGELAEAYVYPVTLTPAQKKEADKQLKAARAKIQSGITAEDKPRSDILQLRFRLEDYLNNEQFDPKLKFSYFLKAYVQLLNKNNKKAGRKECIKQACCRY